MTGQRLLHYQILEKLGEGGMGVVYKARDTHLDRFVAIKVLPPEKVADLSRKARFVQEAKAASAVNTAFTPLDFVSYLSSRLFSGGTVLRSNLEGPIHILDGEQRRSPDPHCARA
jgi:serine/threonine protein kinase